MQQQEKNRAIISSRLRAGRSVREIIEFHNIKRRTVFSVKKKFDEFIASGGLPDDFDVPRKAHRRRSDAKGFVLADKIRNIVETDPCRSMRSIATEFGIGESTVRQTMQTSTTSHTPCVGASSSQAGRQGEEAPRQAETPICPEPVDLLFGREKLHPGPESEPKEQSLAVLRPHRGPYRDVHEIPGQRDGPRGCLEQERRDAPSHLRQGPQDQYRRISEGYGGRSKAVDGPGRRCVFQQDGAPAHNSKRTQEWLKANLPEVWEKEIWPPSSPDCNPLDYFVWGVAEFQVNKVPHSTTVSLISKIKEVMGNLDKATVAGPASGSDPG